MTNRPRQRLSRLPALLIAAGLLASTAIEEASAQWGGRPLPPAEIVATLRSRGFDDIGRLRLDGTTYRLEATSRRGDRLGLVVDAYDAEILERSFRDRDDEILPPRNVGRAPAARLEPLPERRGYDARGFDPRGFDNGARGLDDLPEDEADDDRQTRTDLDDLPPVPAPIYREALPVLPDALRPLDPPPPVETLGEPRRREAERVPPAVRGNPLALPETSPSVGSTVTPPSTGGAPAASRPSGTPLRGATIGPAPAPVAPPAAAAKVPAAADQKNAASSGVSQTPRANVRIIGGVTPVIPRDTPEAAKPN